MIPKPVRFLIIQSPPTSTPRGGKETAMTVIRPVLFIVLLFAGFAGCAEMGETNGNWGGGLHDHGGMHGGH